MFVYLSLNKIPEICNRCRQWWPTCQFSLDTNYTFKTLLTIFFWLAEFMSELKKIFTYFNDFLVRDIIVILWYVVYGMLHGRKEYN